MEDDEEEEEEEDDDDEDEEIPLDMEEIEAASKKARQEEELHSEHIQVYCNQHNEPNSIAFLTKQYIKQLAYLRLFSFVGLGKAESQSKT